MSRKRRNHQDPTKDSSAYWFAALLVIAAVFVILKEIKFL